MRDAITDAEPADVVTIEVIAAACDRCTECAICRAPLSARHEHDHFPLPKRAGGTATHPLCINCHDLKDRIPLGDWDITQVLVGWNDMSPGARLLVAKIIGVTSAVRSPAPLVRGRSCQV